MKFTRTSGAAGPSSAIGIMRFFDVDTGGPKITPEFILIITCLFIISMLALHFMS